VKDFQGRTAFVTGGASGIGLALARTFLDRGMNVMLADVEREAMDAALHSLSNHGDRVAGVIADVSLGEALQDAAEKTFATFGNVHLLCNNAGVSRAGALDAISLSDWDWVIGVNLYGLIHGLRIFVPHMKAHGEAGHIVNTSSMAALTPKALGGVYAATKYAIAGISEVLEDELKDTAIGVSVLCPGFTRTNMPDNGRNRPARFGGAFDVMSDPALAARNKFYLDQAAKGLDPLDLAALVMRAIENNELYIFTEPGRKPEVASKFATLLHNFDDAAARLAAMGRDPPD